MNDERHLVMSNADVGVCGAVVLAGTGQRAYVTCKACAEYYDRAGPQPGGQGVRPELEQALMTAQKAIRRLTADARSGDGTFDYTSADSVLDEGRAALAGAGLTVRIWEEGVHEGPAGPEYFALYRLLHVGSGQVEMHRRSWPIVASPSFPLDKAALATSTSAIAYFLRGLLMMPRGAAIEVRDDRTPASPPPRGDHPNAPRDDRGDRRRGRDDVPRGQRPPATAQQRPVDQRPAPPQQQQQRQRPARPPAPASASPSTAEMSEDAADHADLRARLAAAVETLGQDRARALAGDLQGKSRQAQWAAVKLLEVAVTELEQQQAAPKDPPHAPPADATPTTKGPSLADDFEGRAQRRAAEAAERTAGGSS